jgi:hypothetical protein
MRPFLSVGCISLLALTRTAHAASGSLEVDLVFPQNDTYAPEPIIPVAFAFQNSELASYLQPSVSFSIIPYGNYNKSIASGNYYLTWENLTSSDPYMLYGEALEVLNGEGIWLLEWELSVTNCSGSGTSLDFQQDSKRRRLTFSTKSGAKRPDLTAATSEGSCNNAQSSVFQVMDTRDSGDHFDNRKPCAVLATTTPSASPCGVTIEASAASNVSASLTDRACAIETATWCPEPEEGGSAQTLTFPGLAIVGATFFALVVGELALL